MLFSWFETRAQIPQPHFNRIHKTGCPHREGPSQQCTASQLFRKDGMVRIPHSLHSNLRALQHTALKTKRVARSLDFAKNQHVSKTAALGKISTVIEKDTGKYSQTLLTLAITP